MGVELPEDFLAACLACSVHPVVAAELAVEIAIAAGELRAVGASHLWPRVLAVARESRVTAVPAPQRAYLRSLTIRRGHGAEAAAASGDLVLELPVRLFPRVFEVLDSAFAGVSIEDAVALEVASLSSGRTVIEWTLVTALALLASGVSAGLAG